MKFNEYRLTKNDQFASPETRSMAMITYYKEQFQLLTTTGSTGGFEHVMLAEYRWILFRRAFYNVYPSVVECLEHTSLDMTMCQVGCDIDPVAINFAEGREPKVGDDRVTSILMEFKQQFVDVGTSEAHNVPILTLCLNTINSDGNCEYSALTFSGDRKLSETGDDDRFEDGQKSDRQKMVSIAVGVALLSKDERFAEPILLRKDRHKKFATEEDYQRAVARAYRRGRHGIAIGRELESETSPHVRRPHFGIRWTGKGGKIPRLVPVKGCVVKRDKIYPVPTGYLDSEVSQEEGAVKA